MEQNALVSFNEDSIKDALIQARGDIFIAAQLTGVTALRLDRAVRLSPELQSVYLSLREMRREDVEFDTIAMSELEKAIQHRLSLYRVSGLDSLNDLATMPISDNSAQNQVKLAAAARLAGSTDGAGGGGEIGDTLRSLNELYQANAPRIRLVRERLTLELSPGETEIPEVGQSQPSSD